MFVLFGMGNFMVNLMLCCQVDQDIQMSSLLTNKNELPPPLSLSPDLSPPYPLSPDKFNSSDASLLLKQFESLQLQGVHVPDVTTNSSSVPPPDMLYLKSFLTRLKQEEHPTTKPEPEPQVSSDPEPSLPYLYALLHRLKHNPSHNPNNGLIPSNDASNSAQLLPDNLPFLEELLYSNTTSSPFLSDRSHSAFHSYQVEPFGDVLDQEVYLATQVSCGISHSCRNLSILGFDVLFSSFL